MAIDLTAVLVTFNSEDGIEETITQLESALAHLSVEIIAVDNASSDNTVPILERCLRNGRIIALKDNIGYGPGLNVGLAAAQGRHVLLMNDDIRFDSACVDRLIGVLDSSDDIALVGPGIIEIDGTQSPAARTYLPGWKDEWARVLDLVTKRRMRTKYPTTGAPVDVGLLVAACIMGKTEVLRALGGFNESFFFYGEDIDLCRRLDRTGYRRVLVPEALAVHHHEMATDRRYRRHVFMSRMLDARDTYYRIWLSRPSRMLMNLYRALGPGVEPFKLRFHLRRAIYDGPNVRSMRRLPALATEGRSSGAARA
jgi:GT2 family glycosyltransferase